MIESNRAQHTGNGSLGAYRERGICGGGALCGVIDIGVGATRLFINNPDVLDPLIKQKIAAAQGCDLLIIQALNCPRLAFNCAAKPSSTLPLAVVSTTA